MSAWPIMGDVTTLVPTLLAPSCVAVSLGSDWLLMDELATVCGNTTFLATELSTFSHTFSYQRVPGGN